MLGTRLQKRLRIETLEEKIPLAMDVAVTLVNGDLIVTGDDNSGTVDIGMYKEEGVNTYRISVEDADSVMTFNGSLVTTETLEGYPTLVVTGVTRDVRVNLGAGDNILYMLGNYNDVTEGGIVATYVPRDLVVNVGGGDDLVSIGIPNNIINDEFYSPAAPVGVGRDVSITGGQGNDILVISGSVIGDDLTFSDTQGDNLIEVTSKNRFENTENPVFNYLLFDTVVAGDISVTTGPGADVVGVATAVVEGNITINTSGGDDQVDFGLFTTDGSVLVNVGSGTNVVSILGGTVGGGLLVSGSGTNILQADLINVASSIVMLASNGDDQLIISNSTAGSAIITAGGGADSVVLADSAFDLLTVSLGAGSDTLTMSGVTSTLAILLGGGGSDTLQEAADNSFLLAIDLSFEVFEAI